MQRSRYLDDQNLSSQGNLESQDPDKKTDHDRIKDLELKFDLLDRTVTSLKIQIKFIADMMRKETL